MKKIGIALMVLFLCCPAVSVKADVTLEKDDPVLYAFLKEAALENIPTADSKTEEEYRKVSSPPIDRYLFRFPVKDQKFEDLFSEHVLTYVHNADDGMNYQTVFDFQNTKPLKITKEDFIRLETDPQMYLFELVNAELWTRNTPEEDWTFEREITTLGNPDFYLPYSQFSSDKKYFRILASFRWTPDTEHKFSVPSYRCIYTSVARTFQIPVNLLVLVLVCVVFLAFYRKHSRTKH